jgi:hypothetical protein
MRDNPVFDAFVMLVAGVVIAWMAFTHPSSAQCPRGFFAEGIRRSGAYECKPAPIGDTVRDARGILHDNSVQPPGVIAGQLYCSPSQVPVLLDDGRSMKCR